MRSILLSLAAAIIATSAQARPFTHEDLIALDRISALSVSPNGRLAVFQVRTLSADATKGVMSIWVRDLTDLSKPEYRLPASEGGASDPQFSGDGKSIYFASDRSGSTQVWRTNLAGDGATQITNLPLDVA